MDPKKEKIVDKLRIYNFSENQKNTWKKEETDLKKEEKHPKKKQENLKIGEADHQTDNLKLSW